MKKIMMTFAAFGLAMPLSVGAAGAANAATGFDLIQEGHIQTEATNFHGRKRGHWKKHRRHYNHGYRHGYRSGYRDNYYRDNYYRGDYVRRDTRIWRGRDGRYYCRRDNGTTGLLIGAAVGGLAGHEIAGRGDRTLGVILGAAGGAILGRAIDRSNYRCR